MSSGLLYMSTSITWKSMPFSYSTKAAAMAEGAGGTRIQLHHGAAFLSVKKAGRASRPAFAGYPMTQCTSFQYTFFRA
jgi:hypothetical protein